MNYTESLKQGLEIQNIPLDIKNTPINVYLKHTGDILKLCFLEKETYDYIIVSETTVNGTEEIRIVPKKNIEYISIFYDFTSLETKENKNDKMII